MEKEDLEYLKQCLDEIREEVAHLERLEVCFASPTGGLARKTFRVLQKAKERARRAGATTNDIVNILNSYDCASYIQKIREGLKK